MQRRYAIILNKRDNRPIYITCMSHPEFLAEIERICSQENNFDIELIYRVYS